MNAWARSLTSVPPNSIEDLTPPKKLLLLCQLPDCVECKKFESYGRASLEMEMKERDVHIVDWDCADPKRRTLALGAGVGSIPAYVLLDPEGEREVVSLSS